MEDRLLERRRHGQRLPRGAGLHRQGRSARIGPGFRAHVIHHDTDAAGPAPGHPRPDREGRGCDRLQPERPEALNPALDEAKAAGIKTVAVDAYVTDPDTYNLYNNQVKYAYLGAKWLFEQMGGKGTVYYMRGFAGHPADTDRDIGFKKALENYPDIKVVPSADGVHTGWNPAKRPSSSTTSSPAAQYDDIQGIWTSGMDSQVVDAIKAAAKPFVPIVGADLGAFVNQLLDPTKLPRPEGRSRHQHRRRRRRGHQPRAQAPQRRDGPDRPTASSRTPSC